MKFSCLQWFEFQRSLGFELGIKLSNVSISSKLVSDIQKLMTYVQFCCNICGMKKKFHYISQTLSELWNERGGS